MLIPCVFVYNNNLARSLFPAMQNVKNYARRISCVGIVETVNGP